MALSDKNILITPNVGQSADPKIEFKGADASTGAQTITLQVYPTDGGTISFEGSAGQLFSITNSLSGTIYSVNDVSGIPSIEVLDTGLVKLAEYGGNVLIGTGSDNGVDLLQVDGSITATVLKSTVASGTAPLTVASTTAVTNLNADLLDGNHASAFYLATNPNGYTTNTGTVTSIGGTGTVSGLTLTGTVTTSGNLTLGGTLSASIDNLTDEHRIFNNMGDNHGTRTSFDASAPSYNFGWRFVQGSTNGPGVNSATQYYSLYVGLGNDYGATGAGSYGMQLAIPRNVTTPYLAIRYNENNSLGSWQKINAGYADTSGNATTATTLETSRTITIGSTGRAFNGSENVSWTLADIGAAATNQTFYLGTTPIAINRSSGSLAISNVDVYGNLYGGSQSGSTPPTSVTVRAGTGINAALGPPSNGYGGASTTIAGGQGQGQGAAGGTLILLGGEATGVTSSGTGGSVYITGGKVTSTASIVKIGGNVVIDGGGSGANGSITYGTVYIGFQANGTNYGTKEIIIGKSGTPVKLPGVGTSGFVKLGAGGELSADTNTYAASSHTHNYAGSSSAGGAANSVANSLTIQFNGTSQTAYNGSAAVTHNITPSAIGAAPTGVTTPSDTYLYLARTGTNPVLYVRHGGTSGDIARFFASTTASATTGTSQVSVGFDGSLTATGNVTAYSDLKLKTDLVPINSALSKVQQLTGYTFTRKDTGKRQTGLVAQEVRVVLPEAVVEKDGYLSLAYGNLVGLLVEAIKEQQSQIKDLKKLVESRL